MEEKVYTPTVIQDNPLPGQNNDASRQSNSASSGTYTPQTIKDNPAPTKIIAHETIGAALNTKSKRIMGEFQFTETGALQVGKYEHGITGDLKISPNGITARDLAGITTFAIDGSTGDAVFKGSIESDSLITGQVQVGNDSVIIDGENKRIIINDGVTNRIVIGNV